MYRGRYSRSAAPRGRLVRRRFGSRLRPSTEPRRWEVGHFFLSINNVTDQGTPNATIVTAMGQIGGRIGVTGTTQGRALENSTRYLEIGGIVFRYRIRLSAQLVDEVVPTENSELVNQIDWRLLLCSDRLDAAGVPASIPDWFNVTTPIAAASALTQEDEDTQYPTRIHWQGYHGTAVSNRQGNGTGSVGPIDYTTDNRTGGGNLRLRLRLDDEHGLFWHFAQRSVGLNNSENIFAGVANITGVMYYRFVLGRK